MRIMPPLIGPVTKMQLDSEYTYFGIPTEYEKEIEQRVTITAAGRVYVSRYYSSSQDHLVLKEKKSFSIPKEDAVRIMEATEEAFANPKLLQSVDDSAFGIILTNMDGEKYHYFGSMDQVLTTSHGELSNLIRETLHMPHLWIFRPAK